MHLAYINGKEDIINFLLNEGFMEQEDNEGVLLIIFFSYLTPTQCAQRHKYIAKRNPIVDEIAYMREHYIFKRVYLEDFVTVLYKIRIK